MKLPDFLLHIAQRAVGLERKREPDVRIGGDEDYMRRWFVIPRNPWFNIYYHHILKSDEDRALHDHPWLFNISVLLCGSYIEVTQSADEQSGHLARRHSEGTVLFRVGGAAHRLVLPLGVTCRTLFITGPRVREWGFHCPQGWKHWKDFTSYRIDGRSGRVGPGCGEP